MVEISKSRINRESGRISNKRMFFYTLNGIFGTLMFSMWGQIQFFAASVLLIPLSVITLIYLLYSIIDGFNDPILGYLSDRSSKFTLKYGKRFPWIMIGYLIAPILLIFCFIQIITIQTDNTGLVVNLGEVILAAVWLIIVMCIYESFLTLAEVNYSSLTPDLFRNIKERTKIGGLGMFMGVLGLIIAAFIPRIIAMFGGETNVTAYLTTVIILAIFTYFLIIPFRFGIREPSEMKQHRAALDKNQQSSSPILEVVPRIFKDRNWMALVIAFFLWAIAGSCFTSGLNYYVIHSLGLGIEVTSIPSILAALVIVITVPGWIYIPRRIGAKNAYIIGFIFLAITYLAFFFVTDINGVSIVYAFGGVGYAANGIVFTVIQAEAIDNAALHSGTREEGSYIGILRIFSAFSYFFQTFLFTIVSFITGYNPVLGVDQEPIAKFGLQFQMSIIPFVIILIAIIIFSVSYKITREKAEENQKKLLAIGL